MNLLAEPAGQEAFAPFGDLLAPGIGEVRMINEGMCERHHDLSRVQLDGSGSAGFSIFCTKLRELPMRIAMLERHPDGSQAFIPLGPAARYVAVVCAAEVPQASAVRAFMLAGATGINLRRGIWHHPLIALAGSGDFLVVDRIGPGANLEEADLAGEELSLSGADERQHVGQA